MQDGPPLIAGDHAAEMVGDRLIVVMSGTPNPAAVSPPPAAWRQEKAPALESNRGHPTQEKKLSVEVMLGTPSRSLPHWVQAIESGGKGFVTTIHRAQADLSSGDVHWIFGRGEFPYPPSPQHSPV